MTSRLTWEEMQEYRRRVDEVDPSGDGWYSERLGSGWGELPFWVVPEVVMSDLSGPRRLSYMNSLDCDHDEVLARWIADGPDTVRRLLDEIERYDKVARDLQSILGGDLTPPEDE